MKKNYFLFLLTTIAFLASQVTIAQNKDAKYTGEQSIEGLSIYPNPVNSGQNFIYLTSKLNTIKHIEFYDVLGKRIFTTNLTGRELNISNLNKGVYILKITEKNISVTRKLIVK